MGASPSKDTALEEALSKFDDAERKAMDKLFDSLSSENHLNKGLFQQHVSKCFHETFCERIFSVVAHSSTNPAKGDSGAVTKEDFLISISHILKGSLNQKAQVLFFLASQKEQVSPNDLLELCIILVEGYIKAVQKSDLGSVYKQTGANTEANKRLAEMMLTSFSIKNLLRSVTEDDVENWLGKEILLRRLFEDAFKACFFGAHSILDKYWHGLQEGCEPTVEHVPKRTDILLPCKLDFHDHNVKPSLDMPSMLMLNHAVPTECRHIWRLLFSTACHGKSFTTFLHRIVYQGPTILLVRDAHGAVFGGFASTSWKVKSCFSGDNDCFLFTLKPTMAVYHPTGINDHYMYLNVGMQTIPNGLGMGGQFEYFGLWLDSEFGPGHSKARPKCTTYGSPQLSGSEEFQVEDIEVWGVGVPPEQEEKQRSVLDTETDAQAILDLIGKERKSEGFREPEDSD